MIRSALCAALCLFAALPASSAELRVVAYVVGWQTPPRIEPEKLTHINFAFGKIQLTGRYFAKWRKVNDAWLIESETYVPESCTGGAYCERVP